MKLAIFFLDAVRFQDINPQSTPFLAKMLQEGRGGPLGTLLAYEGLAATLFTGKYPSDHGIWTRYYADPERSEFKWLKPFAPIVDRLDGPKASRLTRPLRYGLMRLSNALAAISYFPGIDEVPIRQLARMSASLKSNLFEPGCFGRTRSLFDILGENGISFQYFDHGIFDSDLGVFRRAVALEEDYEVVVVRFLDLDSASHAHGLGARNMLHSLRCTDTYVGRIVSNWRRRWPDLAVLCFADHGMIPVMHSVDVLRLVNATGLRPMHDFGLFLDSTMARFWANDTTMPKIRRVLETLDCGRILSETDKLHYRIPPSRSWGDLIFLMNPGFVISPNFFDRSGVVRAMHGYDPATPGLDTITILDWPGHISHRGVETVRMIDILPTALDVLELQPPLGCQGISLAG